MKTIEDVSESIIESVTRLTRYPEWDAVVAYLREREIEASRAYVALQSQDYRLDALSIVAFLDAVQEIVDEHERRVREKTERDQIITNGGPR